MTKGVMRCDAMRIDRSFAPSATRRGLVVQRANAGAAGPGCGLQTCNVTGVSSISS